MPELRESAAVELPIRVVPGLLRAAELELGTVLVGQEFPFPEKDAVWVFWICTGRGRAILLPVDFVNPAPGSVFAILHTIHTIKSCVCE